MHCSINTSRSRPCPSSRKIYRDMKTATNWIRDDVASRKTSVLYLPRPLVEQSAWDQMNGVMALQMAHTKMVTIEVEAMVASEDRQPATTIEGSHPFHLVVVDSLHTVNEIFEIVCLRLPTDMRYPRVRMACLLGPRSAWQIEGLHLDHRRHDEIWDPMSTHTSRATRAVVVNMIAGRRETTMIAHHVEIAGSASQATETPMFHDIATRMLHLPDSIGIWTHRDLMDETTHTASVTDGEIILLTHGAREVVAQRGNDENEQRDCSTGSGNYTGGDLGGTW